MEVLREEAGALGMSQGEMQYYQSTRRGARALEEQLVGLRRRRTFNS